MPASSMSQTSLGSLSKALRRSRMGSRKAFMDSDEELFAVVGDKRQLRKR